MPWGCHCGLDISGHQAESTDLHHQGHRPISVDAFGTATGPGSSSVWENHAISPGDLQHIDTTVWDAVPATATVGPSLAITHRGRPVFASGDDPVGQSVG